MNQLLKCFFIIIVSTTSLFSQEKNTIPDIEKTYIHTDRSKYVAGESLWYKAYTVYAYNNFLFNHSNILYVELISADSKIITRNTTKLLGGLGHGDFELTKAAGVKPGKYQIRAYTNWSRNFGKDFVFKKDIEVLDVFNEFTETSSEATAESSETNSTNSTTNEKETLKVQFFPEGGSLIQDVPSVVAFKAVDLYGNPIKVQGKVFDSNNELITFFMSVHDGMGVFQLQPEAGKTYYTKITATNHNDIEVPLPAADSKGILLSYNDIKGRSIITIKTNEATRLEHAEKPITLHYKSKGLLYFEEKLALSNTKLLLELPQAELPEGISQITLFDSDLKPQSERLVYVEKNENVKVDLTTDKTTYKPNEKVTVNITSTDNSGAAVPASYSLAVTDLNGEKSLNNNESNISSYFLMESDIKGKVYNPGYYFDANNTARLPHLDMLLLTQGWRDFLWKQDRKVIENPDFKVEKGINISGRVKHLFFPKPSVGNTISLTLFNKSIKTLNKITDSLGMFNFENLDIIGKARVILTTKNKRGKKNGMFVLDSIFKSPMNVSPIPKIPTISFSPEVKQVKQNIYKKYIDFNVMPENVLNAIEVTGKKAKAGEDINIQSNITNGYVVDESSPKFASIFELLEYAIPTLDVGNREVIKFSRNPAGALILIDQNRILNPLVEGTDIIISMLTDIQPEEVLKIEYDNSAVSTMMYGKEGQYGSIKIYTTHNSNSNFGNESPKEALQTVNKHIEGYYEGRIFYSPDLEIIADSKDKNASIRNTLYWNPYVHPDTTGISELHYYNTRVETNVKLSLEGITASGIPVVVKTTYSIKK
ncbi:hypothetical protein ACFFU1_02245 [Algibacter miyuki]|uniref:Macroglobulin domain-containing protein n=1 Tax=Algibacter miyuki TaxID=1306933 RepID=A0ABV5GW45_9FLAO|nr:hypothetical protein [Algibacter miyuki]MDN3665033.1 hypothetical protein [Algibacter miyuki]